MRDPLDVRDPQPGSRRLPRLILLVLTAAFTLGTTGCRTPRSEPLTNEQVSQLWREERNRERFRAGPKTQPTTAASTTTAPAD